MLLTARLRKVACRAWRARIRTTFWRGGRRLVCVRAREETLLADRLTLEDLDATVEEEREDEGFLTERFAG